MPWASIIGGAFLFITGMVAGGETIAVIKNGVIARMERDEAVADKARATADLKQYQDISKQIYTAAADLAKTTTTLGTQFDTIERDLNDARKKKPLPRDCKPDAGRVRNLDAAIAATNSAAGY